MLQKIALAFNEGGLMMYAILAIQLVSIAIIIERTYFLYFKRKTNTNVLVPQIEETIRRGDLDQVINQTRALQQNTLANAVLAGAQAAKDLGGKEEIQGKMDEVLIAENSALDKRTAFLSVLGNVATLTGLLGTITGMIKSFAAVSYANPADKATLLSAGISEAMNATAYGLIVAVPALVAFAILQNRANTLTDDLNKAALRMYIWFGFNVENIPAKKVRGSR